MENIHKKGLHNLYFFPDIRVIKSKARWAGHVACMGELRGVYRTSVGKPEGKRTFGNLGIDGWIILRLVFNSV
jgi:hypothetical protein